MHSTPQKGKPTGARTPAGSKTKHTHALIVGQVADGLALTTTRKHVTAPASLIVTHGGGLYVDSNIIAELFGRLHKNVMRDIDALIGDGAISRLSLEPRNYIDSRGKAQPAYRLAERDALVLMPFIGGRNAAEGQARLVDEFLHMRAELRRIASQKANPLRQLAVRDKCHMARMMTDCLIDARASQGKTTKAHHYMNEHSLCNWVLTGSFAAIDDDSLSAADLSRLKDIRRHNARLLLKDKSRPQRMDTLRAEFPLKQLEVAA